ncbi:hypothetical protein H257_11163 [Aphanomyces astaci]|uniref:Peptidase n=1 Tax=Aphanomyces astaci TaxID=112090 RepID=W4G5A1_APHAT|nr:hypothetical protein H257_11163 [Aphanomyces astaci]ETV74209.1 hypothetical protein H257_11163 [Aphanomyces astaci]RQM25651.1 hypothetical protein B5M09_005391 [Aphanomyces astaci]|eukprot:XP_009836315.1 hypothetical protein H257_11163 [Aphanomyces astaci]
MLRLVLIAAVAVTVVEACTVIVAGRNATVDGSVLVAHTEDTGLGAMDLRLVRVPAMDHAHGSTRSIYSYARPGYPRIVSNERGDWYKPVNDQQALSTPLGHIPQVKHTYAYFDQDYALINEKQLGMGESSCGAKTVGWALGQPGGKNLFSINELTKVALERCDNAQCAVKTMGDLAVEYGFYNDFNGNITHPVYMSSGEALAIGDKYGEAWVFHVLTGPGNGSAVWAAQRIADDHVSVIANGFVIREMDLSDSSRFLASTNVHTFARDMGWWDPDIDGPFDFTAAYGYSKEGPLLPLYVGRRVWRVMDVVAPSLKLQPEWGFYPTVATYPVSVRPDRLISVTDVFNLLRDHFEGTPFDLTQGIAAGPWGNPNRNGGTTYGVGGGWERAISLERTVYSFVHQASRTPVADAIGGVMWYGLSSPHGSVYVPFSCAQSTVPPSYTSVRQSQFSRESAWWAFNFVNNWLTLRYNVMYPEVWAAVTKMQADAIERYETSRKYIVSNTTSVSDAVAYVEQAHNAFATDVVNAWWTLGDHLMSKYSGGAVVTGEDAANQITTPYPKWWIQLTQFSSWPGKSLHVPVSLRSWQHDTSSVGVTGVSVALMGISVTGLVAMGAILYGHRRQRQYRQLA